MSIIGRPDHKLEKFARRTVAPGTGQARLRCKCGSMIFEGHAEPAGLDGKTAGLVALVCVTCTNFYRLVDGVIQKQGTLSLDGDHHHVRPLPNEIDGDKLRKIVNG